MLNDSMYNYNINIDDAQLLLNSIFLFDGNNISYIFPININSISETYNLITIENLGIFVNNNNIIERTQQINMNNQLVYVLYLPNNNKSYNIENINIDNSHIKLSIKLDVPTNINVTDNLKSISEDTLRNISANIGKLNNILTPHTTINGGGTTISINNALANFSKFVESIHFHPQLVKLNSLDVDNYKSLKQNITLFESNDLTIIDIYIQYLFISVDINSTLYKLLLLIINSSINTYDKLEDYPAIQYNTYFFNNFTNKNNNNYVHIHIYNFNKLFIQTYDNVLTNNNDKKMFLIEIYNNLLINYTDITNITNSLNNLLEYTDFKNSSNDFTQQINQYIKQQSSNKIITYLKIRNDDHSDIKGAIYDYNRYRFNIKLYNEIVNNKQSYTAMQLQYNDDNIQYYNNNDIQDGTWKDKNDYDYNNTFIFGKFNEIFTSNLSNNYIATRMNDIINNLINIKPVLLLGYGASGSGKTSSLIYFSKGNQDNKDGILIHLCNIMAKRGFQNIEVGVKEYLHVEHNNNMHNTCKIINDNDIICETQDSINFHYDTNVGTFLLDNEFIYNNKYKYRHESNERKFDTNTNMSEIIMHIIDSDRFVKATTNNPQSSRSHSIVYLKLKNNTSNINTYLFVGDLAGVENSFKCDIHNTLADFMNIKGNNNIPYYTQIQHGGQNNDVDYSNLDPVFNNIDISNNNILNNLINNKMDMFNFEDIIKFIPQEIYNSLNITFKNIRLKEKRNKRIHNLLIELIKIILNTNITDPSNNNMYKILDQITIIKLNETKKLFDIKYRAKAIKERIVNKFKNSKLSNTINEDSIDINNIIKVINKETTYMYLRGYQTYNQPYNISKLLSFLDGDVVYKRFNELFLYNEYKIPIQIYDEIVHTLIDILLFAKYKISFATTICNNRNIEGDFINSTLTDVRNTVNYILNEKNKQVLLNTPDFINECYNQYCMNSQCFQIKQNNNIVNSKIFNDIFNYIHPNNDYDINKFYTDINIAVFCVFNISKNANNPPPTPYINTNDIKRNFYNNNKHDFNQILPPIFNKLNNYEHIINTKSIIINELSINDATNLINNQNNVSTYNQLLKYTYSILEFIDNINASSAVGTIDFLDQISKYNTTNYVCTNDNNIEGFIELNNNK